MRHNFHQQLRAEVGSCQSFSCGQNRFDRLATEQPIGAAHVGQESGVEQQFGHFRHAQLPQRRKRPMLAPAQMNSRLVRVPKTTGTSSE